MSRPRASFSPRAPTAGRLVADLGNATEIKRVNTYSWHRAERGPQVYKLYAADGLADGFNPKPGRAVDPAKAGWSLIATVDTRPKDGEPGGQYGVSIADAGGAALGKYRYLLFDISRTADDRFGNTFYNEIDIDDGQPHAAPALPNTPQITIDYSEMPELKDWVEGKLRPTLEKWYPLIVEMLPSDGYTAPRRLSVTLKKDARGVAYTAGTRVVCAGDWYKKNLDGEAVGATVPRARSRRPAVPRQEPRLARRGRGRLHPLVQVRARIQAAKAQSRAGQVHRQLSHDGGVPVLCFRET